jgi:hypothetical protein
VGAGEEGVGVGEGVRGLAGGSSSCSSHRLSSSSSSHRLSSSSSTTGLPVPLPRPRPGGGVGSRAVGEEEQANPRLTLGGAWGREARHHRLHLQCLPQAAEFPLMTFESLFLGVKK